jgi:hypothetical protein
MLLVVRVKPTLFMRYLMEECQERSGEIAAA